ncbi:helitron_like_N domain-containing protein, partial [Trichonephila clavipes]
MPGGTGKTFLSLILATIRSQNNIALAIASSELRQLFWTCNVVHSKFKNKRTMEYCFAPVKRLATRSTFHHEPLSTFLTGVTMCRSISWENIRKKVQFMLPNDIVRCCRKRTSLREITCRHSESGQGIIMPDPRPIPLPDADPPKFLRHLYFMANSDEENEQRCHYNAGTRREIVGALQGLFDQHNELVRLLKTAIQRMPADDYAVVIRAEKRPVGQHERQFNAPTIDEVAIVIVGEEFESRDIILHRRSGDIQRVSETHRSYDGLQYPILFWRGDDGYHFNIKMINPQT